MRYVGQAHLGDVLALVAVPRALAGEDAGVLGGVQQAAHGVDAHAEQDVHLDDTEWRGDLVLGNLRGQRGGVWGGADREGQ